jgi:D-arabinose 1-dehydrogenase-like Zn-dependent alcohol dehydrogenase
MKALVLKAYRELEIQDVPAPRPGPKVVVVRG